MALTALQILKFLPKTNCKDCGYSTCLAFAMALIQKKTTLDKCPHITQESKQKLEDIFLPPMATLKFGIKGREMKIGGEEVLFRHEKTFLHPTVLAVEISDKEDVREKMKIIREMRFELLGNFFQIDAIALKNESKDPQIFSDCVKELSEFPLILITEDINAVKQSFANLKNQRPIVFGATPQNLQGLLEVSKNEDFILAVKGENLDSLAQISEKITDFGFKQIILAPQTRGIKDALSTFTIIRRLCLKKSFRPFGFPLLGFSWDVFSASNFIMKYASVVVVPLLSLEEISALITLRLNIYTDPQKPLIMDPGVYEIGKPDENSPVFITTNFTLTYFIVSSEIENSHTSAWLILTDSQGQSVLTAWAADKFNAKIIAEALEKSGLKEKVRHRQLIIPGYVSTLKEKIEEETGWRVLGGPKEASGISDFLKTKSRL